MTERESTSAGRERPTNKWNGDTDLAVRRFRYQYMPKPAIRTSNAAIVTPTPTPTLAAALIPCVCASLLGAEGGVNEGDTELLLDVVRFEETVDVEEAPSTGED